MNFARDVVESAPPGRRALVALGRGGDRRVWSMGELAACARTGAFHLDARGVRRGDVVLTLLGSRPEWVLTLLACFRQGYVALPCTEQLRAGDVRQRLAVAQPRAIVDGELVLDPASDPTFFVRYIGEQPPTGPWRTGDRVCADEDGFLYFEGRSDDVIVSAGYRIGPTEVESVLAAHPAVAEAAVVAAPDPERGNVVRAVVVLRAGHAPSEPLARELQEHVKASTAPYKYPRIVEFAAELPRTASGKLRRAALR